MSYKHPVPISFSYIPLATSIPPDILTRMGNIYHILEKTPALDKYQMFPEGEALAEALVKSGRFRVDAYEKLNFVRFQLPYQGIERMFSERELYDPALLPLTERTITDDLSARLPRSQAEAKAKEEILRLREKLTKHLKVEPELEMKLARLVVQACHPVVIMMIIWERVEVFVSYSHSVGDMLDIQSWQSVGSSSGLQSTDIRQTAVFISTGGDPFHEPEITDETQRHKEREYGDGFPAIARLIVIGAQELGHYSDLMRDRFGRKIGRYSADLSGRRMKPSEKARIGRLKDIAAAAQMEARLLKMGLGELAELERSLAFFKEHKNSSLRIANAQRRVNNKTRRFVRKCNRMGYGFIHQFNPHKPLGTQIVMMIADMKFNLEPKADAYSRPDPVEEEAIACIEALARVPQQMVKWGHVVTRIFMPNLYRLYYKEVIPGCIKYYQNITGTKYRFRPTRPRIPLTERLKRLFRRSA